MLQSCNVKLVISQSEDFLKHTLGTGVAKQVLQGVFFVCAACGWLLLIHVLFIPTQLPSRQPKTLQRFQLMTGHRPNVRIVLRHK